MSQSTATVKMYTAHKGSKLLQLSEMVIPLVSPTVMKEIPNGEEKQCEPVGCNSQTHKMYILPELYRLYFYCSFSFKLD